MPDRDPLDMLCTLQGEESMQGERKRREAVRLRAEAATLDHQAAWHDERVAWFQAAIDALDPVAALGDQDLSTGSGS